jgi:16S rRNA C967 or C1407 C5-methylase (RsmB/RsmF family)
VDASVASLESFARYQKRLVQAAVRLLKPGGILTYSTCTINTMENEWMVRHILDEYPAMRLEEIDIPLGSPGLAAAGLGDHERSFVRRFDPADPTTDSIGFFLAKFQKLPPAPSS